MSTIDTNVAKPRTHARLVVRALRIVSGLYLLAYVTSHLVNLSLGMVSIEAMDAARPYLSGLWTGPGMGFVLLLSLVVHFALGLWTIYKRPTLRTNLQDFVQLLTGLMVVPLLATHAIGVSMVQNAGVDFGYAQIIPLFWLSNPSLGLMQVIMLTVVWVHGCAGLFTWLRAKESARHILSWLYPLAVAIPVVALLGYAEAGRTVLVAANQPQIEVEYGNGSAAASDTNEAATDADYQTPAPEIPFALIKQITKGIIWGSIALSILTLLGRWLRVSVIRSEKVVLTRNGGDVLGSNSIVSVLDGFRQNHQPHASLCEGRGRCGTCAVMIKHTDFPLPPPSTLELRTLQRIGAPMDARLACQLHAPGGRVDTVAIYPSDYSFHDDKPASIEPAITPTEPEAAT